MSKPINRFPKGWDEQRVKKLIRHYEKQSGEKAVAEDEAPYRSRKHTMMAVPVDLVAQVQKLISRRRAS